MAFSAQFKSRVVAGLLVLTPLLVSGFVVVWIAQAIEGFMSPILAWVRLENIPGLGFVSALLLVAAVGVVATTVAGARLLDFAENLVARIPVFRDIYSPVKQLVTAFSPDNEAGFKRVVLAPHPHGGSLTLGFLTREFQVEDETNGPRSWSAVYVPTNHLYLGDIVCYPKEDLLYPDLSVQEGVRIVLTGGASFPAVVHRKRVPVRN